ncbi:MAG: VanZ family protein [Chitinophagaceae bacterium]|nr:VanZ family protein [Chitinophagaceae bacterium]
MQNLCWMPLLIRRQLPDAVKISYKVRHSIPAILWFIFLSVLVYMPGSDVPSIGWAERVHADKVVHFILFGVLFVLISIPVLRSGLEKGQKRKWLLITAAFIIVYGFITEVIQHYFIPGRTFDLLDWAADSAGVIAGFFFVKYLKKRFV